MIVINNSTLESYTEKSQPFVKIAGRLTPAIRINPGQNLSRTEFPDPVTECFFYQADLSYLQRLYAKYTVFNIEGFSLIKSPALINAQVFWNFKNNFYLVSQELLASPLECQARGDFFIGAVNRHSWVVNYQLPDPSLEVELVNNQGLIFQKQSSHHFIKQNSKGSLTIQGDACCAPRANTKAFLLANFPLKLTLVGKLLSFEFEVGQKINFVKVLWENCFYSPKRTKWLINPGTFQTVPSQKKLHILQPLDVQDVHS